MENSTEEASRPNENQNPIEEKTQESGKNSTSNETNGTSNETNGISNETNGISNKTSNTNTEEQS